MQMDASCGLCKLDASSLPSLNALSSDLESLPRHLLDSRLVPRVAVSCQKPLGQLVILPDSRGEGSAITRFYSTFKSIETHVVENILS